MNRQRRKLLIRIYSIIVASSLLLVVFSIASDGLTVETTGPQFALTIAFVAILVMLFRIEPHELASIRVKQRDYINWFLCSAVWIGIGASMWLTFIYSDLKTFQALPFVLVFAASPILIALLLRRYRLGKRDPPAA